MIHYHGTPVSGSHTDAARLLAGRHGLVPFDYQQHLPVVAEVCKSFVFDNSAFTKWKQGGVVDVDGYGRWVDEWHRHPGFAWALIPDVIDGDEAANDAMLRAWPRRLPGVPVWHMHESLGRLDKLVSEWPIVALGSSGEWPTPGTKSWWGRMGSTMLVACDSTGRPRAKLHGLRMLSTKIFPRLPLASADSTNASRNCGLQNRFGMYTPITNGHRAVVIADRIEAHNSAPLWPPSAELGRMLG